MKKAFFAGFPSLLLPLGLYGVPTQAAQAAVGYQRSYLSAGISTALAHGSVDAIAHARESMMREAITSDELDIVSAVSVHELVVIDAAVPDKHVLYRNIKPGVEIVEIDASAAGLAQLTNILSRYKNLSALHIVSHADEGVLVLGNSHIDSSLLKQELELFSALNSSMNDGADILFYGCNLAKGAAGSEFLDIFQANTKLDLAASNNLTGDAQKNGDWDLEIQRGEIDTDLAFSARALADFTAVLQTIYRSADLGYEYAAPSITTPDNRIVISGLDGAVSNFDTAGSDGAMTAVDTSGGYGNYNYIGARLQFASNPAFTSTFELHELKLCVDSGVPGTPSADLVITGYNSNNNSVGSANVTVTTARCFNDDLNASQTLNLTATFGNNYDLSRFVVSYDGVPPSDRYFVFKSVTLDDIKGFNTAPTATNLTQSKSATEGGSTVALDDIVIADPDVGDTMTAILTLSDPAAGTLSTGTFGSATSMFNAGTGVWTVTGSVSDVNAALAAVAFTPSANNDQNFTITTRIRDVAGTGPADGTISVTVTGVNDAPSATNLTQSKSAIEGGSTVALDDIVIADPDVGDTVTATLTLSNTGAGTLSTGTFGSATSTFNAGVWTVTGSISDVNAALAAVAFTPSANNDQNFTITTRIRDAADTGPADGMISVVVTGVNDTPSATNLTQSKSATEDGSAVALDDIVITDPDVGDTMTAILTLSDPAAGTLSTGTFGSATSMFNAGTGVWTVTGSVSDVNAALAAVAFTPSANNDQNFTITTRIRDVAGTGPADGTISVTVTGVNDAPSATNLTQSKSATEDGSAVALDDIVITDPDVGDTVTAILTLSDPAAGTLSTGTFGSATSMFNAGAGVWTVTGSVSDVNAALAAVAFTPSEDNDQNFTITTRIRDAAGTGPADGTITMTVTAVNDAPTDITLSNASVSQTATANGVDVGTLTTADADGSDSHTYSLVSTGAAGSGSCASDSGNASFQINGSTLETASELTSGSYSLCIQTSDGTATYKKGFVVTISDDVSPVVSTVTSSTADGTYGVGDMLAIQVNFSEAVTVTGTPQLTLETGATDRTINYASGSGSSSLTFNYTIHVGDNSSDLDYTATNALALNGGTINDSAANAATLTLASPGAANSLSANKALVVDGTAPTVSSVSVPANATYTAGQDLEFTVNTSENVTVDTTGGAPRIALTIGATTRYAGYISGSGTTSLVFRHTVLAGDDDADGIAVGSLDANSGILRDAAGNELSTTLNAVGSTAGVLVDASPPTVSSVSVPVNGTYAAGQNLDFTVNTSENVTVDTSGGTPRIGLTIGATTRYAGYVSGSGTTSLVFRHTVLAGDSDADGIAVDGLDANSGTLRDAAGNNLDVILNSVGATGSVLVDTVGPAASIVVADAELLANETSLVTITFNEAVTGFANDDLAIANGSLDTVTSSDGGITWTATFTPEPDIYALANVISLDNTGVTDAAGNTGSGTTDSNEFTIRTRALTLLVTSNLDTGDDETIAATMADDEADGNGLSLREALFWARSNGDTITFDLDSGTPGNQGGTITLGGNQLTIEHSHVIIDGDLDDDGAPDVTISGNNASRVMRVAMGRTNVELKGLVLTQGAGNGGGGALALEINSSVTLRDASVTDSHELGWGGGGIYGSTVTLYVVNSTISGNSSDSFGGGIRLVGSGVLHLINSTVSNNSTTGAGAHGAGIQYAGPDLLVMNSTVSGNAAMGVGSIGGGIRISSGAATVHNSTIVGNAAADSSGGVSANGTSDVFINTVVAGNASGAGAVAGVSGSPLATGGIPDDVGGTIETGIHNFFGTLAAVTTDTDSLNNQGTSGLLLADLAYHNGSTVQVHVPQSGSLLLNAGDTAALPVDVYDLDGDGDTAEPLPVDAAGAQRVAGSVPDIGAVEGNTVPVLANLDGGNSFTEGGAPVIIDSDVIVVDAELALQNGGDGNYSGASLTILRSGGANAEDGFGFADGHGISLVTAQLMKNGQAIATFDTGVDGQVTVTFTDSQGEIPTQADVNHILQQITYANSSDDPATGVTLTWSFADEAGDATTETATVVIVPVNDAPTISGTPSTSVVAGTPYLFVPSLNDLEGDVLTVTASNLPAWASLDAATGTISGTPGNIDAGTATGIVLTVSDGEDSMSLPAFAIEVVFDGTLDSDGDGIPDGAEQANGLNPFDPADAAQDADGDGVSNLDEYLADTDLLADDYGPVFPVLDVLNIDATGLLTPRPALTAPVAMDGLDGPVTATLSQGSDLLAPGLHTLIWAAEDAAGNRTEAAQPLHVHPLISLGRDQVRGEGATAVIRVLLNGTAPVYPFTVGFTVEGTADSSDHDLSVTSVTFDAGDTERQVAVTLFDDGIPEGTETLRIRLDESTTTAASANFGSQRVHDIQIVEENIAPSVALQLQQGGEPRRIVTHDGGLVQITAMVDDPNPGDTHDVDWQFPAGLVATSVTGVSATFDPALLAPGVHEIGVVVTEDNPAPLTTRASILVRVMASAPVLGSEDSDNDGIDDATEGLADTDGDGQPDYLDSITLVNVVNETSTDGGRFLVEGDPGLGLELGAWSLLDGADGVLVSGQLLAAEGVPEDVIPNVGGYFDFVIRDLPEAGASARIVLPQRQPVPTWAVYRKYAQGGWFDFVEDTRNQLASAAGAQGVCPPTGSDAYTPGLTAGHWCVQVTIEDGGPNDADGSVNGSVVDPGGVGGTGTTEVYKTQGGGGALGLPMLAVCLLLALSRRRQARGAAVGLAALLTALTSGAQAQAPEQAPWWDAVYLQGGLAYAHTDFSRRDAERRLGGAGAGVDASSVDNDRLAWHLGLGYALSERWALEMSYLDLGEVDMTIAAPITAQPVARVHPESGKGWAFSGLYLHPLQPGWWLQARVGLFDWQQDYKTARAGDRVDRDSDSGMDLLWGLGVAYQLSDNATLTSEVQGVDFDREATLSIGVGLRLRFD